MRYAPEDIRKLLDRRGFTGASKVDVLVQVYNAHRGSMSADRITTDSIAQAIGVNDEDREELALIFRAVDRDRDVWLQCADLWLAHLGILPVDRRNSGP